MSGSGCDDQVRVIVHQRMLIQPGGGKAVVSFYNGKIIIAYPTTGPPNTHTVEAQHVTCQARVCVGAQKRYPSRYRVTMMGCSPGRPGWRAGRGMKRAPIAL